MGILDRFKNDDAQKAEANAAAVKPSKSSGKAKKSTDAKSAKGASGKNGATKKSSGLPADLRGVILHPLVTEKAATMTAQSKYVFVVDPNANRIQVRNAVRKMYGINPISVNVVNVRGKRVRFGRIRGARKDWKKAIVTFPKGTTIDAYEGV